MNLHASFMSASAAALILSLLGCASSPTPSASAADAPTDVAPAAQGAQPHAKGDAEASASSSATESDRGASGPAAPHAAGQDAAAPSSPGANTTAPTSEPAELPKDTRVLHIGDSFAGALGYELNKELKLHGIKGTLKYEKSTYIPTWAWNKELPEYLWKYHPDLVLITLGGNELKIPDPNKRAETVRRLVGRLKGKPCVWIGIPLWEGANPALMGVIKDNVAPCLFLDSTELVPDLERAGDGIHPNTEARSVWAKAVVRWLQTQQKPGEGSWRWR